MIVVVVEGPAGIGKSALLTSADGLATERDFRVLCAGAGELDRELPWNVIRDEALAGYFFAIRFRETV